ncbi:MAG: 5-formyltetrahydrofolate cyclo-ligase [Alsobacter sp.]
MTTERSRKAALRSAVLDRRDSLPADLRRQASLAIADRVLAIFDGRLPAGPVAGFWPIRSEIDPRPVLGRLADLDIPLCLPAITTEGLQFRLWQPGDPLRAAGFGLSEPRPEAAVCTPDVMLVPLAAFDRRGHRIGYGAGHYDRAIARLRPRLTLGLAFSVQEVETVPDELHDRALDWIVTEREAFAPAAA